MEERTTPYGMWRYGNDFRQAAIEVLMLHHTEILFMPYYFLLGQSIELSLKSFLLASGVSLADLRNPKKFGHDLKILLNKARRRDLKTAVTLEPTHCSVVTILGREYLDKRFQYIKTGRILMPDARLAQEAADLLSDGLKRFLSEEKNIIKTPDSVLR
jgi:hypothetical protein